jgi:hypothetical protein
VHPSHLCVRVRFNAANSRIDVHIIIEILIIVTLEVP